MNIKLIALSSLLFFVTQLTVWFQINGQFVWKWFDKNPIYLSLLGVPISYMFIIATKMAFEGFGGILWPQRLLVFSLGIISFAFCTYYFMGESLTTKTYVSLLLAMLLVLIQVFWK